MKKQIIAALLASSAVFASNVALANTVYFTHTFDLTQPSYQTVNSFFIAGAAFGSQQVQIGDVVDLTYTFKPGQFMSMSGGSGGQSLWAGVYADNTRNTPNTSTFSSTNISFDLIGAGSNYQGPAAGLSTSGGMAHIGPYYSGNFIAQGQTVTFSGMHSRFTVTSLEENPHSYDQPFFWLTSNGGTINVGAVPEPETYALMLASLGLLAFMRKKKAA